MGHEHYKHPEGYRLRGVFMNIRFVVSLASVFVLSTAALADGAKKMAYSDLVKGFFGVSSLKKAAPTLFFLGTHQGALCSVTGSFLGQGGTYSEANLAIGIPND